MKRAVKAMDFVEDDPCPKCGGKLWVVDTDGIAASPPRFWLLCAGSGGDKNCVETKPIPADMEVIGGT